MTSLVQQCVRRLDTRWVQVPNPAPPMVPRQAGFCARCMGLAEACDIDGTWWHVVPEAARECMSSDYAYKTVGVAIQDEARFQPDANLRNSIQQAIKEASSPKYSIDNTRWKVQVTPPNTFSHDAVCGCQLCTMLRDPNRQTGTLGEIFVTSEEYKALKDSAFDAYRNAGMSPTMGSYTLPSTNPSRISPHPPGCDCKDCDYGY